jgi:hypothetical protein
MVVPKKLGSGLKIVGRKVWRAARQETGKREKGSTNPQKLKSWRSPGRVLKPAHRSC